MKERTKYKAAIMIFMTVLASVSMFFSVTAAWFVTIKNAEASAGCFKIDNTYLIDNVKYYQYKKPTGSSPASGVITFGSEESSSPDLGVYNLFESNYQTLMEITLTEEAAKGNIPIDLIATTKATKSHLTADNTGKADFALTNAAGQYNSLSSIVDFYAYYESDISISDGIISLSFADYKNNIDSMTNKPVSNFTNDKGEIIASKTIKIAHFNTGDIANKTTGTAKIYLMLTYNEENCAKMYGNNIGNTAIEVGHAPETEVGVLKFEADFNLSMAVA